MEFKAFAGANVYDSDNDRVVIGFPLIMGNIDAGADIIHKGATKKTLQEQKERIKWLWGHQHTEPPIAKILSMTEVGAEELPNKVKTMHPEVTGAVKVVRVYLDTPRGNEVLKGIKEGAIQEASVGYDSMQEDYVLPDGTTAQTRMTYNDLRNLRQIKIWEFSDVNWGMNEVTTNLKALGFIDFQDFPIVEDQNYVWRPEEAIKRLKQAADLEGKRPDWGLYAQGFLSHLKDQDTEASAYSFPYVDVVNGKLVVVPEAINDIARLLPYLPVDQKGQIQHHLTAYYSKMGQEPAWEADNQQQQVYLAGAIAEVEGQIKAFKAGRVLSKRNMELLTAALTAITEVLGVDPEDEENFKKYPFLDDITAFKALISDQPEDQPAGPSSKTSTEEPDGTKADWETNARRLRLLQAQLTMS